MRRFVVGVAIGLASIAPNWAQANDDQIAQEIIDKLQERKAAGQLRGFNIDLEVDHGVVWMKGNVGSAEQQKLALDAARRVKGVEKVVNELKVEGSESAAEAPKVQSASRPSLFREVFAKALPSDSEKNAKPSRTSSTPVASAPVSAATQVKSDDDLVRDVMAALKTHKTAGRLKGFQLEVQADQGVVWLSGRVANADQQSLVIETVRRVSGVTQVVNDLQVNGGNDASAPTPAVRPEGTGVSSISRGDIRQVSGPGMVPAPQGYTAVPVNVMPAPAPFVPGGAVAPVQTNAPRAANRPLAFAPSQGGPAIRLAQSEGPVAQAAPHGEMPMPAHMPGPGVGVAAARYDHPNMPGYAWPSYAAYPNYAAVTYPKQYSPAAWPYIGPFYPYPQVPLGWRKVSMQWDDGWWYLDFKDK